jgi:beta-lactamase regulating signal transducer with metallopeptidase domain
MNWDILDGLAGHFLARVSDASIRAAALGILAGVLVLFLRKRPAAQHAVWALVTLAMVTSPILRPIVPVAHLHWAQPAALEAITVRAVPGWATNRIRTPALVPLAQAGPSALHRWRDYLLIAYLAGVMIFAARLMLGLFLAFHLLRGALSIGPELEKHFDVGAEAGVDLEIEESNRVRVPVTAGLMRMRIILPAEWREWSDEKMGAVLAHESAHVRRRDPLVALMAATNKCVFWFHPLAWWLERRLAALAEHAADDAGMAVSPNAESYARIVIEVASRMQKGSSRLIWHAAAMNGPLIARRIRRVMDPRTRNHSGRLGVVARVLLTSSLALLLWITTAADFQNLAQAQAAPQTPPAAIKVGVVELNIEGAKHISIADQGQIAASIKGRTYSYADTDGARDEVLERIRAAWQNRGYFKVVVRGEAKVLSSGPGSARIAVNARVDEGEQYRLGGITFRNNQAIGNSQAREMFPVKDGDIFSKQKIGQGLENFRKAYGGLGYARFECVPDIRFDDAKKLIYLDVDVNEGEK